MGENAFLNSFLSPIFAFWRLISPLNVNILKPTDISGKNQEYIHVCNKIVNLKFDLI